MGGCTCLPARKREGCTEGGRANMQAGGAGGKLLQQYSSTVQTVSQPASSSLPNHHVLFSSVAAPAPPVPTQQHPTSRKAS